MIKHIRKNSYLSLCIVTLYGKALRTMLYLQNNSEFFNHLCNFLEASLLSKQDGLIFGYFAGVLLAVILKIQNVQYKHKYIETLNQQAN